MQALRFFLACTFTFLLSSYAIGQAPRTPKYVLEQAELIKTDPNGFEFAIRNQIVLSFAFGKSHVINQADVALIREVKVKKVSLVYSWMPHAADTDHDVRQEELNLKRLQDLHALVPEVFEDESVEWEFIVQTNFEHPNQARELFHGFIVHY